MTSSNGLICFTNCLLPLEDGNLVERDLWVDERRGVILDAQRTFFLRKERPDRVIDLGGNILRYVEVGSCCKLLPGESYISGTIQLGL
ncbi:hypothetical protein AcV5_002277 [Taiwanofungus camphoratus]|nr:hypothetical protein AcV5_002277 [Antrodia cinnamomea]